MFHQGSKVFIPISSIYKRKHQPIFYRIQWIRTFLSTPMPEVQNMDPTINSYEALYKFSIEKPDKFWGALAPRLTWNQNFSKVLQGDFNTGAKWFLDGKLNASVNCVDRHAMKHPNRIAIIHEKDEPGQEEYITYSQLQQKVIEYAYLLRTVGNVKKGDRVAIYMSCSPGALAMCLACARIGAIHSIVFAGFSSEALASRINDAQAKVVVTNDILIRSGKTVQLKKTVDKAVKSCKSVQKVFVDLVDDKNKDAVHMNHPRDHFLQDLLKSEGKQASNNDVIEYVDSNDPLFILYTSGSTGSPKGLVHSTGGYLLYAMITQQYAFNFYEGQTFGCVADIGWITGHSYIMYGPLLNGGTTLLFESTPIYPDPGRYWELVQRLKLTHFYCAPTALRLLMKHGDNYVKKYDRSSLKIIGSVGEPINPEAWHWYNSVVGENRCELIDTWWQTETGGICLSPRPSEPGAEIIPAMAMRPMFGIKPILAEDSVSVGPLCIRQPWPGLAAGIFNSPERFRETYFSQYPPYYFTGDGAEVCKEGYWKITGRMDDVINTSGHRIGTAEVESALGNHPGVSESAVVGFPHDLKGEGIFAFVTLKHGANEKDEKTMETELKAICKSQIAAYAMPDYILFTDHLPKTRSGKIMRRILRKVAAGGNVQDLGDVSTLAEPWVVKELVEHRKQLDNKN